MCGLLKEAFAGGRVRATVEVKAPRQSKHSLQKEIHNDAERAACPGRMKYVIVAVRIEGDGKNDRLIVCR